MRAEDRQLAIERTAAREAAKKEKAEADKRNAIRRAEEKAAKGDTGMMCLLHLWDLKRFGYSPTRTELKIPSERPAVMIRPTDPTRIYGGSAANF